MKTILFVLPDHFSIRNFLYSPFIEQDFEAANMRIVFVLTNPEAHRAQIPHSQPIVIEELAIDASVRRSLKFRFLVFLSDTLNYRFTKIEGLNHIDIKEAIPQQYVVSVNDRFKLRVRFPFPKSRLLYRLYHWLYNSNFLSSSHAATLVEKYKPDVVITSNPQAPEVRAYYIEAKRRDIKTLSYINSWDYLLTDGPVMTKIDAFIGWNEKMRRDLQGPQHCIKPFSNIGPIHMDYSFRPEFIWNKEQLYEHLNVPIGKRLITYGVCGERIGKHEPGVAAYLADHVLKDDEFLIIRGHPEDKTIPVRFAELETRRNAIICQGIDFNSHHAGNQDDRIILYSLMKHSDVVICGPTTLTLDALRFDTPVINVGFDGNIQMPEAASIQARFKLDHFAPLLTYSGVYFAKSFEELTTSLRHSLETPNELVSGRKAIRRDYLEPLDGKASERMFEILEKA